MEVATVSLLQTEKMQHILVHGRDLMRETLVLFTILSTFQHREVANPAFFAIDRVWVDLFSAHSGLVFREPGL